MSANRYPDKRGEIEYIKYVENATFRGKKLGFYPWEPESFATRSAEIAQYIVSMAGLILSNVYS
jgi:hypothetical protein